MNIIRFEETPTANQGSVSTNTTASPFGGSGIIIWVIFGVVILALIGYFVYQSIKTKVENKRTKAAAAEYERNSKLYWYETTVKLNKLIDLNHQTHENFVVSIGEYKMSHINMATKSLLNDILDEYEFKNFIIQNPKFQKEVQEIQMLRDLNSNLWEKKFGILLADFKKYVPEAQKIATEAARSNVDDLKTPEQIESAFEEKYKERLLEKRNAMN
ncbi:MHJ_0274 family protein [Mycoplasma sp. 246B]